MFICLGKPKPTYMHHPVTVVYADNDALYRYGFERIFENAPGVKLLAVAASPQQIKNAVDSFQPQVLMFELDIPGMNGVEICNWLHQSHPEVKSVAFTRLVDRFTMRQMREAGVFSYINKAIDPGLLLSCIQSIGAGNSSYCKEFVDMTKNNSTAAADIFNDMELKVVELLCLGYETPQIAQALHRGKGTINHYRLRVAEKMGTKNPYIMGVFAALAGLANIQDCRNQLIKDLIGRQQSGRQGSGHN